MAFATLSALPLRAEEPVCELALTATAPVRDERFGHALAVSGDYLFVGAPRTWTAPPSPAGSVHVFRQVVSNNGNGPDSSWIALQRLMAFDGVPGDHFGWAIAADGTWAVVSARGLPNNVPGTIYVYRLDDKGTPDASDDRWIHRTPLVPTPLPSPGDSFGTVVAIRGEWLAVGAPGRDAVYMFRHDDAGTPAIPADDLWPQAAYLTGAGVSPNARFGQSLYLNDDQLIVGATAWNSSDSGAAYVFRRQDNGTPSNLADDLWIPDGRIEPNRTMLAGFGNSVFVSGDLAVVGTGGSGITSLAQVFARDNGDWRYVQELMPFDRFSVFYGSDVIRGDGNWLAIGAGSTVSPSGPGAIFVFRRQESKARHRPVDTPWKPAFVYQSPQLETSGFTLFGYAIAWSPSWLLAGEPYYDPLPVSNAGAILAIPRKNGPTDCNTNTFDDACDLALRLVPDCNGNVIPDDCDIANAIDGDCDGDLNLDGCEKGSDCNENGVPDRCDVADGTSDDANADGFPDECRAEILYVDTHATGANSGNSWANSLVDLQVALALARAGHVREIRIAGGTYFPGERPDDPSASFHLVNGVRLVGGFAGSMAADPDIHDPSQFPTILSCDLAQNDASGPPRLSLIADNCFHVVRGEELDASTVIEHLVITGGQASSPHDYGGGLLLENSDLIVRNCRIQGNHAGSADYTCDPPHCGGVYIRGGAPVFEGCAVDGNSPESGLFIIDCLAAQARAEERWLNGGGFCVVDASVSILRSRILRNNAGNGASDYCSGGVPFPGVGGGDGGGLYVLRSVVDIADSLIAFNRPGFGGSGAYCSGGGELEGTSPGEGGALFQMQSSSTIQRSTIVENTTGAYGGPAITTGSSIVWHNGGTAQSDQISSASSVDYSTVQGWMGNLGGIGNSGDDPLFVGAPGGDFRLQTGSPAVNAGDPGYTPTPDAVDLDGRPRVLCGRVDMGAYEFPDCAIFHHVWRDCLLGPTGEVQAESTCASVDTNGDSKVDLSDFARFQSTYSR